MKRNIGMNKMAGLIDDGDLNLERNNE